MESIPCPNCQAPMRPVSTTCHYGSAIILDQCPQCGGIWLDDSELYRVKLGEAAEIENKLRDQLDLDKLKDLSSISPKLHCPRDRAELKDLKDKSGPFQDLSADICPICDGIWLNRGLFDGFQQNRMKRRQDEQKAQADKMSQEVYDELSEKIQKQAISLATLHNEYLKKREKDKLFSQASSTVYTLGMVLRLIFLRK